MSLDVCYVGFITGCIDMFSPKADLGPTHFSTLRLCPVTKACHALKWPISIPCSLLLVAICCNQSLKTKVILSGKTLKEQGLKEGNVAPGPAHLSYVFEASNLHDAWRLLAALPVRDGERAMEGSSVLVSRCFF